MPQGETVLGPVQVNNEINRTNAISQAITLLNTQGSRVIAGQPAADPRRQLDPDLRAPVLRPGSPAAGASRSSSSSSSTARPSVRCARRRSPKASTCCSAGRTRPRAIVRLRGTGRRHRRRRHDDHHHHAGDAHHHAGPHHHDGPRDPRLGARPPQPGLRQVQPRPTPPSRRATSAPTRHSRSRPGDLVAQAQTLALAQ